MAKPATAKPSKKSGSSLGSSVKSAGTNVNRNEALRIAESTGKTVAQVMAKAVERGATLGANLVNQYNAGKLGPNASSYPMGLSAGASQAIESLRPLDGLRMGQGQIYAGHSTTTTPGYSNNDPWTGGTHTPGTTVYNPVVLPRTMGAIPAPGGGGGGGGAGAAGGGGGGGRGRGGRGGAATDPAPTTAPGEGPIGAWEKSVQDSNNALIESINAQIAANAEQAQLYMGSITQLMQTMVDANKAGGMNSITPYASTSTTVDPVTGAKTTVPITARPKPTGTDLSVSPLVSSTAGTGLSIAI
jgi:hypothetical protein